MIAVCDFVQIKTFVVKRHENGLCEVLDDRMDVMIKPDDILYITRRPDKSKLYLITLKNSNACFAVTKRQLNKLLGEYRVMKYPALSKNRFVKNAKLDDYFSNVYKNLFRNEDKK